jgi:hypothetical protein
MTDISSKCITIATDSSCSIEQFAIHGKSVSSFFQSETSIKNIVFLSLFFLASAHLALKTLFPLPGFWVVGASLIVGIGSCFILKTKDVTGFFIALFACVHFNFADNQGGLWSYIVCTVYMLVLLFNKKINFFRINTVSKFINLLFAIFIIHQLLGLLINNYSLLSNAQSLVVICSHIIIFYSCASIDMSKFQFRRLSAIWFGVAIWVFFVAINQKYHWFIVDSPVLPYQLSRDFSLSSGATGASFGNSELFSEYYCFVYIFSIIIYLYSKEFISRFIKHVYVYIMIFSSAICLMMGGSRSAILLAVAATMFIFMDQMSSRNPVRSIKMLIQVGALGVFVSAFLLFFGDYISLDETLEDFMRIDLSHMSFQSVASGESINRGWVFEAGVRRLGEGSWWIGYGYGIPDNNRISMGINNLLIADYHSLYLQLPFFYGWIGSLSYIFIVFFTGLRSFICYMRNRNSDNYLIYISLGFSILCAVFLIDQYKISVTRNPSYYLLTWFFFGFAHSVVNTINFSLIKLQNKC